MKNKMRRNVNYEVNQIIMEKENERVDTSNFKWDDESFLKF